MIRFPACFSAVLLSCCVSFAQNPTQAPAPTAATAPATSTASPEIREFQKIEDSWSIAVNNRDQYGLELVLSPLFVDVSASGDISRSPR